ncbi:uncharacterized protein LOC116160584 [Photinus pyralis]|uniref:uncharacterized protein LOC116160190 n=1 Tax=Photinus pyralis TaxID=7054 RepID=UPI001267665F|nr:uncharacterized protein LOC116160190 [Photinus pyralis]XP_031329672.1 uncharacterized protein LOC116160584 [Photinus pyralis]
MESTDNTDKCYEVEKLLSEWGFEKYINAFKDQEIDTVTLRHIEDAELRELIPLAGPRVMFKAQLKLWRNNITQSQINTEQTEVQPEQQKNITGEEVTDDINREEMGDNIIEEENVHQPATQKGRLGTKVKQFSSVETNYRNCCERT